MIKGTLKKGSLVRFRTYVRHPSEIGMVQSIKEPDKDYYTLPADYEVQILSEDGSLKSIPYLLIDEVVSE